MSAERKGVSKVPVCGLRDMIRITVGAALDHRYDTRKVAERRRGPFSLTILESSRPLALRDRDPAL